ncbi:hypothetical protein [Xenorhabdus anantnagensis]|uniref:Transposase n=1 Tax=Xenorhabdus anantnagensis TaxID=3025875 RepID=A0ABT5LPZ7_9GAMM|nr:hypothetical protein [Xenorhabdus anantnagensis]MDC9596487.1 hypothetical protein [Xenorhabdus anantnagensis]
MASIVLQEKLQIDEGLYRRADGGIDKVTSLVVRLYSLESTSVYQLGSTQGKRGKLSRGVWGVIFERGVREGTAKRKNSDLNVDHCRGYKTGQVARRPNGNKKRACPLAVDITQVRVSMLTKNGSVRGCKKPNSDTLVGKTDSALAIGNTDAVTETKYRTVTQENKQGAKEC